MIDEENENIKLNEFINVISRLKKTRPSIVAIEMTREFYYHLINQDFGYIDNHPKTILGIQIYLLREVIFPSTNRKMDWFYIDPKARYQ